MPEVSSAQLLELRKEVAAAVGELYQHGLFTPTGGNLSVRCPDSDHILVTASQVFKGALLPEHVLEVNAQGRPVGEEPAALGAPVARRVRPSVETGMHLAVYESRPDVGAVVHTHAPISTLWGLFDGPVPALTLDCLRFTGMRTVPFAAPGSRELALLVAEALVEGQATLLRNHGLVTVGKDLREACNVALALEESLRTVLWARLLAAPGLIGQEPAVIPPKAAEFLRKVLIG